MKNLPVISLILSMSILSFSPVFAQEGSPPNSEGYCGTCPIGAQVGELCICELDAGEWKELGYKTARCVRNDLDPNSGIWLCQLHGFGK